MGWAAISWIEPPSRPRGSDSLLDVAADLDGEESLPRGRDGATS